MPLGRVVVGEDIEAMMGGGCEVLLSLVVVKTTKTIVV